MRDLVRQVVELYTSTKLEGQEEGVLVFSGREPDTKQRVWIKIPARLVPQSPEAATRFRTWAQRIRQLNHPNIVPVRAVGEKAGLPYLVTRMVEAARPLSSRLDEPWDVAAAADLVMQAGQALEHAYQKGVFHGSLLPQNLLVLDNGQVRVTDLGTSALLELLGVKVKQLTSPHLAPERIGGAPSSQADVYSLGAILYRLLAGRESQIVKGQVLPPGRFNTDVPPGMDEIVTKALAQDPQERYANVKAFLVALGAVVLVPAGDRAAATGLRIRCPNCGTENQAGRFCRKCGARLDQQVTTTPQPAAPPARKEPAEGVSPRPRSAEDRRQSVAATFTEIERGKGVEMHDTVIARPMAVATGELAELFPPPLEMPSVDLRVLTEGGGAQAPIAMPEPLPIPVIDWAEIMPPPPELPTANDAQAGHKGSD